MKKICLILALFIICLSLTCVPVSAAGNMDKVVDNADILTDIEESELESTAQRMTTELGFDIVIVTTESLGNKSAEAYADDFFDYNGYGVGKDYTGVLFLISMEGRDWAISTCGKGIAALSDSELDSIFYRISSYLSEDRYYEAFSEYLAVLESELNEYIDETTVSAGEVVVAFLKNAFIGAIIAGIALFIMSRGMKTDVKQKNAVNYVVVGTYNLKQHSDRFLYTNTTKTRRSSNSSSGGRSGGGSSHRSSSGRSHGGRSGKF